MYRYNTSLYKIHGIHKEVSIVVSLVKKKLRNTIDRIFTICLLCARLWPQTITLLHSHAYNRITQVEHLIER